eukprot:jgi/Mesen1/861/ME000114S10941
MVSASAMALEDYREGILPSIYLIPDYINEKEEELLIKQVYAAPAVKWKPVTNRRLQNWVPPWLNAITERLTRDIGLFPKPINHVLVNEYKPGQGIMPHQDGPLYHPVVAILSLGSSAVMHFTPHPRLMSSSRELADIGSHSHDIEAQEEAGRSVAQAEPTRNSPLTAETCQNGTASILSQKREEEVGEAAASPLRPRVAESVCSREKYNVPVDSSVHALPSRVERGTSTELGQQSYGATSVRLLPRSLLVFKDAAYTDYLHGIDNVSHDVAKLQDLKPSPSGVGSGGKDLSIGPLESLSRPTESMQMSTRLSLTCRVVLKVRENLFRL